MKEQKILRIILPLLVLSLTGLVVLQVILLTNVYEQKEQAFKRNVNTALQAVARSLETREVQAKVFSYVNATSPDSEVSLKEYIIGPQRDDSDIEESVSLPPPPLTKDLVRFRNDTLTFRRSIFHPKQDFFATIIDSAGSNKRGNIVIKTWGPGSENDSLHYKRNGFSYSMKFGDDELSPTRDTFFTQRRNELMTQALDVVFISTGKPIEHNITAPLLDTLIAEHLTDVGIDLPYVYGVAAINDDSLHLVNRPDYYAQLKNSPFATSLFSGDFLASGIKLQVYFPDWNVFILKQMSPSLAATTMFTLIIIGSFFYTLRTIYRQKRFSSLLVEFINNMTHEFKTPISTITVATETIALPEIRRQEDKLLHFNTIIRDEIGRMRTHVDKILQMAVLEEGDYELQMTSVDIHEIIRGVMEKMALHVGQRGGSISSKLDARRHFVRGDPFHLVNIIFNLLDNATKYSPDAPMVTIATGDEREYLCLSVKDNGIGISSEDQRHVFDKYYRVSTGDRHDVRGFGLGLSYVKLMVEAHHGNISLESEPGKGTTVTIKLPYSS